MGHFSMFNFLQIRADPRIPGDNVLAPSKIGEGKWWNLESLNKNQGLRIRTSGSAGFVAEKTNGNEENALTIDKNETPLDLSWLYI